MLRRLSVRARWLVLCALLVGVAGLLGAASVHGQVAALHAQVGEIVARIEASPLGEPMLVESRAGERERQIYGEVHALVAHEFAKVAAALASAASWCDIVFLHLNVKACVPDGGDGLSVLHLYVGRRHFQTPAQATLVELQFRVVGAGTTHLVTELSGERGPHGSRNVRMELEAMPAGTDRTLVRFRYELELGALTQAVMGVYLATAGRHRIGFSMDDGSRQPVRGLRGMIERNAMRFYLGLQAYLDTLHLPEDERITARLENWFDHTERYAEQLRELDRDTYLDQKRRELAQQRQL
jgi:hypothetical protein